MNDNYNVDNLTAQALNNHYAAISTDWNYFTPKLKLTSSDQQPLG